MSFGPKWRTRLGLAGTRGRPSDIDSYDGRPAQPYPEYERIIPRDLVQMLEGNFRHLWRECAPDDVPIQFQGLKTVAHDELWGYHSDDVEEEETPRPVSVRSKPAKKIEPKQYYRRDQIIQPIEPKPTERAGLTKDQILGKDHLDPFIQKYYPDVVFNRSGVYT